MQEFLNLFSFSYWQIGLIIVLVLLVVVQLYFYFAYFRLPYKVAIQRERSEEEYDSRQGGDMKKVSVIIASENEAQRLSQLLPVIFEQDYPDFEVIVVSDGSTDDTDDVLTTLKLKHKNLYSTYVPFSNDKKFGRRKLAYTLGIKAATGDILLFTEPYSTPISKNWIYLMTKDLNEQKEIVLGASFFRQNKLMLNRLMRFDNHILTMQYLAKALKGQPFTGVYRNVAYKKNLFFDNKGFSANFALENAEDAFINQIVTPSNTLTCLNPDAFTESDIDNGSLWRSIKKNYSMARSNFKNKGGDIFDLEMLSRVFFYLLLIASVVYSVYYKAWGVLIITGVIFLIRYLVQLIVINKASKYFKSGKFYLSLLIVDILAPMYNVKYRTRRKKI